MVRFLWIVGLCAGLSIFMGPLPIAVVILAYLTKWVFKK